MEEAVASENAASVLRERYELGDNPVVLCLPGSRISEVTRLAPVFTNPVENKRAKTGGVLCSSSGDRGCFRIAQLYDWQEDIIFLDPRDQSPEQGLALNGRLFGR